MEKFQKDKILTKSFTQNNLNVKKLNFPEKSSSAEIPTFNQVLSFSREIVLAGIPFSSLFCYDDRD